MLKDKVKQYISEAQKEVQISQKEDEIKIEIFKEEYDFVKRNSFLADELNSNITFTEKDPSFRFSDSYIERCDKETENVIANEPSIFLKQPISFLKKQKKEFIYLESNWFELIGVDAVSIEADDVFGTYDVMLGLKLQKKFESTLKEFLNANLHGDRSKFDLVFSQEDGLWNLNFALNYVDGFQEEISIEEAYQFIYHFLFKLVEAVEEGK